MISKRLLKAIEGFARYLHSSRSKGKNERERCRGGNKDISRTY